LKAPAVAECQVLSTRTTDDVADEITRQRRPFPLELVADRRVSIQDSVRDRKRLPTVGRFAGSVQTNRVGEVAFGLEGSIGAVEAPAVRRPDSGMAGGRDRDLGRSRGIARANPE
jgi:hypothetical protein